jgi:hypothetical protein
VHSGRPESTEWKSKNAVCGPDSFHQFDLDSVTASKLQITVRNAAEGIKH